MTDSSTLLNSLFAPELLSKIVTSVTILPSKAAVRWLVAAD